MRFICEGRISSCFLKFLVPSVGEPVIPCKYLFTYLLGSLHTTKILYAVLLASVIMKTFNAMFARCRTREILRIPHRFVGERRRKIKSIPTTSKQGLYGTPAVINSFRKLAYLFYAECRDGGGPDGLKYVN